MRDYGIVSPRFWIGETGKSLRGDMPAQILAVYLMTSPHSNMTGVFHCPIVYMAHETGLDFEGASKALQRLIEGGFCEYDEASETVFVVRMAMYQVGESLKPGDLRIKGLQKEVDRMVPARMRATFLAIYGGVFHLSNSDDNESPLEAPCKTLRSQEQEQEKEQEQDIGASPKGDLFPGIPEQVVRDFRALRKSKKAAITPTAVDGIRREATKAGLTLQDALVMCCERGWGGFKAEWVIRDTINGSQPQPRKTRKELQ